MPAPPPPRRTPEVGGGHAHDGLFVAVDSPVHRLRPECKIAGTVLTVLAVVVAPREAFWVFAAFALLLVAVARLARVPLPTLAHRLTVELPFVAFAFLLPFVSGGRRIDLVGLSVSSDGLWAAWNILVKGTLGVAASGVLAATTPVADLLRGLERLHLPRLLTGITGFMIRYGDLLGAEVQRMRIARLSRGYDPRWIWQVKALATSSGALFVRSFERGERVYLSMVSRGFDGTMPVTDDGAPAPRRDWTRALAVPAVAAVLSASAWAVR